MVQGCGGDEIEGVYVQYCPVLTPRRIGLAKYLASDTSDATNEHSMMSLSPLRACSMELVKRAPAYAMAKVADP